MQTNERSSKLIATWLLIGVGMTVVQIALGGITRLTGSGLSITQWDVVTGSLPPLNDQQWLVEYNKYRLTPQFQILNFNFSIGDFKMIFFWEWFHRLWARTIGMVFIVGFVWLLVKKHFKKQMIKPLLLLFVLGGFQGAIGWIMVKSGLTGDAVYVQPTKLALHFIFALGLLCYTYWFALSLLIKPSEIIVDRTVRRWNITLIVLIGFQLIYGALMAGHKAANVAATWPSINGHWIPEPFLTKESFFLNTINNKLFIHFVHRGLAYLLLLVIVFFTIQLFKKTSTALLYILRPLPIAIVFVQIMLGILTVLSSINIIPGTWGVFEWIAELHQLFGMLLLLSLVSILFAVRPTKLT